MLTDVFAAHAKADPGPGGTMNAEEFLVTCYTYKLIPCLGSRSRTLFCASSAVSMPARQENSTRSGAYSDTVCQWTPTSV